MQTSKIGSGSNWQQFIKLAQDARMRNNGLSGAASSSVASVNKMPTAYKTSESVPNVNVPAAAMRGYHRTSSPNQIPVRILGGKFDGWA